MVSSRSIIVIVIFPYKPVHHTEGESFKPRRLTGLTAYVLPAWLTNFVAACSLAHSTAAYDDGFGL